MYSFYQAAQYYQLVLDRFYRLSEMIAKSLDTSVIPLGEGFVTPKSVSSYFSKLIKASSQKSRVWSEIAKKYQYYNRADLARRVIERAYVSAFIENLILSQLMQRTITSAANEAEVKKKIELAQLTYSAAMLDMKNVYKEITDEKTFFGFTEDYIPFPALYRLDPNAFVKLVEVTRRKVQIAQEKEQRALEDNRSFETDSASFQSELAQIKREYDNQLSEICGTFVGDDGNIYPAIQKYAQYSSVAVKLGDPCGRMGNGDIFEASLGLDGQNRDHDLIKKRLTNVESDIEDEKLRVSRQCTRIGNLADFRVETENRVISLSAQVLDAQNSISALDRIAQTSQNVAQLIKCSIIAGVAAGGDCPLAGVAAGVIASISVGTTTANIFEEQRLEAKEREIDELQRDIVVRDIREQCESIRIDGEFAIRDLVRRATEIDLEAQKKTIEIRLALAQIEKLVNKAQMLQAQQAEAEEMVISVQSARNDPNVRIYRNDAVIAADRTFNEALSYAYRLTKVYEYYTAQSYPDLIKMPLIRMVSYGDYSLESYLSAIEEAFYQFEEIYGVPDDRVMILSLKDDIFKIPLVGDNGEPLASGDIRKALLDRLSDPALLDDNGYIVIPFSTSFNQLSPLTHNHKIQYVMVALSGSGGDYRRVYLRQVGTGVIRTAERDKIMMTLPRRMAVINTFDNTPDVAVISTGDGEIFKSTRLRDFPLVNTSWELILNLKDESDNEGIDLADISDVKLYIFYQDFTSY